MISWGVLLLPTGIVIMFATAAIYTRWSDAAYAGVRLSVLSQKAHIAMGGDCLIVRLLSWCIPSLDR